MVSAPVKRLSLSCSAVITQLLSSVWLAPPRILDGKVKGPSALVAGRQHVLSAAVLQWCSERVALFKGFVGWWTDGYRGAGVGSDFEQLVSCLRLFIERLSMCKRVRARLCLLCVRGDLAVRRLVTVVWTASRIVANVQQRRMLIGTRAMKPTNGKDSLGRFFCNSTTLSRCELSLQASWRLLSICSIKEMHLTMYLVHSVLIPALDCRWEAIIDWTAAHA